MQADPQTREGGRRFERNHCKQTETCLSPRSQVSRPNLQGLITEKRKVLAYDGAGMNYKKKITNKCQQNYFEPSLDKYPYKRDS